MLTNKQMINRIRVHMNAKPARPDDNLYCFHMWQIFMPNTLDEQNYICKEYCPHVFAGNFRFCYKNRGYKVK